MKREFDGKVKLTGVGYADGIKAEKLIVGDTLACTFGYSEKIIKIEDISKSYILVSVLYESICTHKTETSEKKIKKDRIVPVSKLFEESQEKGKEIEAIETFESVEKEIEEVEKELLNNIGLDKLMLGTGFNFVVLEAITPFDSGKFKVKKGHRMMISEKVWNEYKDNDYIESCGAIHPKSFYKVVQDSIIKTEHDKNIYNKLMALYKKSNVLLGI